MSAAASNIANMDSAGPVPATPPNQAVPQSLGAVYQPAAAYPISVPGGGVAATVEPRLPGYTTSYEPAAPYANPQGMVARPNVDLASEAVDMIGAMHSYRANLAVFKASSHMFGELLDITS